MSPPQLSGNNPVVNIFHPAQESLIEARVGKTRLPDPSIGLSIASFSQWPHFDKPLRRLNEVQHTTNRFVLNGQHCESFFSILNKTSDIFQIFDDRFTSCKTIHASNILPAKSFMVPSSFITLTRGKLWRLPTSKSFGSWAGVIFTTPVPNS